MKFRSCVCLILYLSIYAFFVEGLGGLSRAGSLSGFKSLKSGQKINGDGRLAVNSNSKQANSEGDSRSSRNGRSYLSAWGIISLIMLVIVGSVLVYYVSIFYPLVCAKRGKYDVMEMTAV